MVGYILYVALCRFSTLHVCLGVDLGGFRHCMWMDSGELCYFRPSELVSPRREYQSAHCHENSPRRPFFRFERRIVSLRREGLAWARSRDASTVARLAWARIRCFCEDSISPEREFVKTPVAYLAWARIRCISEASVSPERVYEWVLCFLDCLNDLLHALFRLFLLNMI